MKILSCALILSFSFFQLNANYRNDSLPVNGSVNEESFIRFRDSVNKSFQWQHGEVVLPGGEVKLNIPDGFKFIDAEQSRKVLEDLWGNLEDKSILGMIFPVRFDPLDDSSWAYVITYQQLGFVKDSDADKVDYDELLKDLKEESKKGNEERKKAGLQTMELIGWAQKPFYDKNNKVLHWAKEYKTAESRDNTLNYDIRILGRKGVLSMNAVAGMANMPEVRANINEVLKMAAFTQGNAYKDFDSNVDEVAAWTIGGLVAGKVLAKAGLLAVLIKFWKLIAIGLAIAGGSLVKFFKKKKQKHIEYASVNDSEQNEHTEHTEPQKA